MWPLAFTPTLSPGRGNQSWTRLVSHRPVKSILCDHRYSFSGGAGWLRGPCSAEGGRDSRLHRSALEAIRDNLGGSVMALNCQSPAGSKIATGAFTFSPNFIFAAWPWLARGPPVSNPRTLIFQFIFHRYLRSKFQVYSRLMSNPSCRLDFPLTITSRILPLSESDTESTPLMVKADRLCISVIGPESVGM